MEMEMKVASCKDVMVSFTYATVPYVHTIHDHVLNAVAPLADPARV